MNEGPLRTILSEAGVEVIHRNTRGWLVAQCPFAPFLHQYGRDTNPSFFVKVSPSGYSGFNCFRGDTKFITKNGVMSFIEAAGTMVPVLAGNGEWIDSEIKKFGKDRIWRLRLSRHGVEKVIYTTENHRWFTYRHDRPLREVITCNLKEGWVLGSCLGLPCPVEFNLDGFLHGVVFGDGTIRTDRPSQGVLKLYGGKMALSEVLGVSSKVNTVTLKDDHVRVTGAFGGMKKLPSIDVGDSYLKSFIYGWIATDGCVSGSVVTISNKEEHILLRLRDLCYRVGIATYPVRIMDSKEGRYGDDPKPAWQMTFARSTLEEDFFKRQDQRNDFSRQIESLSFERNRYAVVSVEPTDEVADVFCASVPGEHTFTLDDGILTGNCFTCHQKGNLTVFFRRLGSLRGQDLNHLAIRALIAETPDQFEDWDQVREEERAFEELVPLDADTAEIYYSMYPPAWTNERARDYLMRRATPIGRDTCAILDLRYDPDEQRILFPVLGASRELFGFTGRTILDPEDWPREMGGVKRRVAYSKVKDYGGLRKEKVILGEQLMDEELPTLVVEGLFALAHMVEIGVREFCNPVATMGSYLCDPQKDILIQHGKPVFMLYDRDAAGDLGLYGERDLPGALEKLKPHLPVARCRYPKGVNDPDLLTLRDVRMMVLEGKCVWE